MRLLQLPVGRRQIRYFGRWSASEKCAIGKSKVLSLHEQMFAQTSAPKGAIRVYFLFESTLVGLCRLRAPKCQNVFTSSLGDMQMLSPVGADIIQFA